MVSEAVKWVAEMWQRYIATEGEEDAYLRGLHYFIVSLKESERQIPTRKGTRTYENTTSDYKKLSELAIEARKAGLIPFEQMQDHKNEPLSITIKERLPPELRDVKVDSGGYINITIDEMLDWDEFIDKIALRVSRPQFCSQTHRLVLIIEKSKAYSSLAELAKRYGADFIQFGGQHSFTRVYDIAKVAKQENKPIHVFYICDLDCAGWFMPQSFFKRLQEIYPHTEHCITRIALTREQAIKYNLPPSFEPDDKKYPPAQVEKFKRESSSDTCIEVDALSRPVLLEITENALKTVAALDKDEELYNKTKEQLENQLRQIDFSAFQNEYSELTRNFNELVGELESLYKDYERRIDELKTQMYDIEDKIKKYTLTKLNREKG